jgi:uncharacterized protein
MNTRTETKPNVAPAPRVKELSASHEALEISERNRDEPAWLLSARKSGFMSFDKLGLPTLQDILGELSKPGRAPRKAFEMFSFAEGVEKPGDLTVGMKLPGLVTNVTAFGAFVDIGVHQDGLVHVSQLSDQFVRDPGEVVKVGQKVQVTVMEVDLKRNRIGLSMKSNPDFEPRQRNSSPGGNAARPQRRDSRSQAAPSGNDWFTQAMSQAKKK